MSLVSRPSIAGNRPAYLDNLFTRYTPKTSSVHSSTSSISTSSSASNYDLRSAYAASRPLSPPMEEDGSDAFSTHSKKSFLSRRFRMGTVLHRRTYPQGDGLGLARPHTSKGSPSSSTPPSPPPSTLSNNLHMSTRRPSLPKLQTEFPPPQAISTYAKKPLPAVPGQIQKPSRPKMARKQSTSTTAELNSQRCYYFAARNCQGWVLGGEPGDACEACLQSGYFGAK